MSNFEQEHIEIEPFDREYHIKDLLPANLLKEIGQGSNALLPDQWAIFTDNGSLFFQIGAWSPDQIDHLSTSIINVQPEKEYTIHLDGHHRSALLPIEYELEIKGYMAVHMTNETQEKSTHMGQGAVNLLKQLIRLKHQTMLTSGLHGQVVKDSYAELKQKAQQLARSEEKYRHLAENLEFEVKKKTEEIKKAHAHIMQQEKMAAIGQLSAGMAHEINNPLGFIISNLTTLRSYGQDLAALIHNYQHLAMLCQNPEKKEVLPPIQAQCKTIEEAEHTLDSDFLLNDIPVLVDESIVGVERIRKIVKDLKTVARPGEIDPEPINVHESIDAVLTIVQNRITPEINVQRSFSPVPLIPGYPQEINQIWLNLILNALDAMEDEGVLEITIRAAKGCVTVIISDTGYGITEQNLPKIFDPFFTTKDVGQGTGLGLHLVYNLITKHDGHIEVQSRKDIGSTFTVHLPAMKEGDS